MNFPASTTRYLAFSLGPVQGWIDQARRTRDFWAGSFLLSWLSAAAAEALVERGGKLIEPTLDPEALAGDDRRARILSMGAERTPYIARFPNRFVVKFEGDADQAALCQAARDAVWAAWGAVAAAVWRTFLEPAALEEDQKRRAADIWDSQIGVGLFWEMHDGVGAAPSAAKQALRDSKRYRRRRLFPGDAGPSGGACSMIPGLVDLSGQVRTNAKGRAQSDLFWQAIGARLSEQLYGTARIRSLELRESERLSAVALIKRCFPLLPYKTMAETIGWFPGDEALSERMRGAHGEGGAANKQRVLRNFPSTAYLAARDWLVRAAEQDAGACETYRKALTDGDGALLPYPEQVAEEPREFDMNLWLPSVKEEAARPFAALTGGAFFDRGLLRLAREDQDNAEAKTAAEAKAAKARIAFEKLREELAKQDEVLAAEPSPYYAILRFDGDAMGKAWGKWDRQALSDRLTQFATQALKRISRRDAVPLFAGGDDLLALAPASQAMPLAREIHEAWCNSATDGEERLTISGAVLFSDYQAPLRQVLAETSSLLERSAKEENGRDSLAVGVYRNGGLVTKWVNSWTDSGGTLLLDSLDAWLAFQAAPENPLGPAFVYRMEQRVGRWIDLQRVSGEDAPEAPGDDFWSVDKNDEFPARLLALASGRSLDAVCNAPDGGSAAPADHFARICHRWTVERKEIDSRGEEDEIRRLPGGFSLQALYLSRFLQTHALPPPSGDAG